MADKRFSCGIIYKQPAEVFAAGDINLDWTADLGTSETISTCVVTITDADGTDVTSTLASGDESISGAKTSVALRGGTDGEDYWVEHVIQTSGSSTKARGHLLRVSEKDRP